VTIDAVGMDWLEQLANIPSSRVIERLLCEEEADHAEHLPDGRVVVRWSCASTDAHRIASVFGARFELEHYDEDEMIDNTGEGVDIETATRVDVCAEHRAILESVMHWQAGFCGTLTVHPDRGSYDAALRTLEERIAEREGWHGR